MDSLHNVPSEDCNDAGGREVGFQIPGWFLHSQKLSGESIWLGVPRTKAKRQGEIESSKKEGPTCLAGVQLFRRTDCTGGSCNPSTQKKVPSLLPGSTATLPRQFHCKQLPVVDVVVALEVLSAQTGRTGG